MRTEDLTATEFTARRGRLEGCRKDSQSITSDWEFRRPLIAGVAVKEVKHVPKENGHLTEVYRADWRLDEVAVSQVFQVALLPGGLSAWHSHQHTTDRLFANHGLMKIVLFDARTDSPTHGMVNEFRFGAARPALVVVPPGVWHGVKNLSHEPSLLLNLVDRAYDYESPDHWRLPADTELIPYRFGD
jgi:dTDP-4-dehydrorhamnose 3,5-epimerase